MSPKCFFYEVQGIYDFDTHLDIFLKFGAHILCIKMHFLRTTTVAFIRSSAAVAIMYFLTLILCVEMKNSISATVVLRSDEPDQYLSFLSVTCHSGYV